MLRKASGRAFRRAIKYTSSSTSAQSFLNIHVHMAVYDSTDLLFAIADPILSIKFYPGMHVLISEKIIAYL